MTASVTAGDRNTVTYANDTDRSLVNSVTDANGVATGYSYDSMRRLGPVKIYAQIYLQAPAE